MVLNPVRKCLLTPLSFMALLHQGPCSTRQDNIAAFRVNHSEVNNCTSSPGACLLASSFVNLASGDEISTSVHTLILHVYDSSM